MIYRMDVKGCQNTPIRAVLIPAGEPSPGGDPNGIWDKKPVVEFYDLRHAGPKFTPEGQLITRYYLSTLIDPQYKSRDSGLCLWGSEPSWAIDSHTFSQVRDWALYLTYEKPDSPKNPPAAGLQTTNR